MKVQRCRFRILDPLASDSSSFRTWLLDEANVRHVFYRVLEKASATHSLSRPAAHVRVACSFSTARAWAYVRDQMGHGSIQVTVDVYGHLVPGGNRAAVDRLDDAQPSATPAQPSAESRMVRLP